MTYNFLKELYADVLNLVTGIVVKRQGLMEKTQTARSARSWDLYQACSTNNYHFNMFSSFDRPVLEKFYTDEKVIGNCMRRPTNIPVEDRKAVMDEQAKYVIDHYTEYNDYYRMLIGQPNIATPMNEWIYVKNTPNIPDDIPVHQMNTEQISRLETRGILDKLKKEHRKERFKYLDFLGANGIDNFKAHYARPFDILRLGICSNPSVRETFLKEYTMARRYVMAMNYNPDLFASEELYDSIVGTLMLTLAVRNTLVPDEKTYLDYEEILNAILESYDLLQYFKGFPHRYKQRLVLALDKLLMIKGTDQVIVDVCKLFSPDDLEASRYYLLKYQSMDVNGNVNFSGNYKHDYEKYFLKTPIEDHEIFYEDERKLDYNSVTSNDYLWQMNEEETKHLTEMNFNLMMTKYIGVDAAFDITAMVFETCCFLNLLLYARYNLSSVYIYNRYAYNGRCNLFTMTVFLLATMAKRANFDGNIVYGPREIHEVWARWRLEDYHSDMTQEELVGKTRDDGRFWRFNYEIDQALVDEIVAKYELQGDIIGTLLDDYEKIMLRRPNGKCTAADMVDIFVANRALFNALEQEMTTTQDIRRYEACQKLKDALFTSVAQHETFEKADGTYALTYYEMLEDLEPKLAAKLRVIGNDINPLTGDLSDTAMNELNDVILYVLEQLENYVNSAELQYLFLGTASIYGAILNKYIITAINVFKASSVQFHNFNIIFKFGDRDPIRVLDEIHHHKFEAYESYVHVQDECTTHKTIFLDDYVTVGDKVYTNIV